MDALVQQLQTNSANVVALLKQNEGILHLAMQDGSDPLIILAENTIAVIFILIARLTDQSPNALTPPPWQFINSFCDTFDQEAARLVPEKVLQLAKTLSMHDLKYAILPLLSLATRYPPAPSTLTPMHTYLLINVLQTGHIAPLVPFLTNYPIDDIDSTFVKVEQLGYNDNLIYHYLAGTILTLAALPIGAEPPPPDTPLLPPGQSQFAPYAPPPDRKLLEGALGYFEQCVCAPSQGVPAAIQLEALKKMRLVQCLVFGAPQPLPKYASSVLGRLFKSSPYNSLVNAFAQPGIRSLAIKDQHTYEHDRNWGLVLRLVGESESGRWQVKRLIESYVRLSLEEIGRMLGWVAEGKSSDRNWEGEQRVRALILGMIESGMIRATLNAHSVVTFHDEEVGVGEDVDISAVLQTIQEQSVLLQSLDQEITRSKEFLTRVVKGGSGSGGGYGMGMGMGSMMGSMMGMGGPGMDDEDMAFGEEGMYA
ncbi:cop9 signalosome complex subunit 3 [Moniliophthora roreri MCA 2997]|uniref:Cop9 signalosome complex subunit 3 n=2 Tax=Moniliophthora roreri TaxID=221103 RepID=V2X758_MONRO|nr:cop9 signalosome complex subunit 3 [Moniliophthora roreri MCA 2997]KAI3607552.1 cop9 signalosome complex subunit 3 [Moniliophthora roreri]